MKTINYKLIIKLLLGLLFLFSAISKLVSIDQFEIYVFSYHFFSLNISMFIARLVISAELILGTGFLMNISHRLFWWGNILMLGGFTLLVLYAWIIGRTDSCHCFGEILPFTPKQSFIKNIVLLCVNLPIYNTKSFDYKRNSIIITAISVICLATVFIASPPDNFTKLFNETDNVNKELFEETFSSDEYAHLNVNDGKKVVCFYSTGCRFCRMAAHKLSIMQKHYGFPEENITNVFMGTEEGVKKFYTESESAEYKHVIMSPKTLLLITDGNLPTIVFINNGQIEHQFGYRNLDENKIKKFFKKE